MYYYLVVGSNIQPDTHIGLALEQLCNSFGELVVHPRVSTEPWNVEGAQQFINTAVEFESNLSEKRVNEICKQIEELLGRPRNLVDRKTKDRTCDIDICGAKSSKSARFWNTQTQYFICAIFDPTSIYRPIKIKGQQLNGQDTIRITLLESGEITIEKLR